MIKRFVIYVLKKTFHKACFFRLEGKEQEALKIMTEQVPLCIGRWVKGSNLNAPAKKATLMAMFQEEMQKSDDAAMVMDLTIKKMESIIDQRVEHQVRKALGLKPAEIAPPSLLSKKSQPDLALESTPITTEAEEVEEEALVEEEIEDDEVLPEEEVDDSVEEVVEDEETVEFSDEELLGDPVDGTIAVEPELDTGGEIVDLEEADADEVEAEEVIEPELEGNGIPWPGDRPGAVDFSDIEAVIDKILALDQVDRKNCE